MTNLDKLKEDMRISLQSYGLVAFASFVLTAFTIVFDWNTRVVSFALGGFISLPFYIAIDLIAYFFKEYMDLENK